ncbi:purine nucleoside phosphorylase [Grus americana]|uniref:purine nucleoside phosphorylase n=1 Tax=Grus americana TaxID=9117 RepID=UPI0024079E1D|nr:purine nucleoside phosphorylase [Grus americana]
MESSYEACAEAAAWVLARVPTPPRVALICGSGLGALAQELRDPQAFAYADIPHFPRSTVAGHAGQLVLGQLGGVPCAVLQGRFHLYEGYSPAQVTMPVRVLSLLGVHTLVLTNAAGSLQPSLGPGHLLVIRDHIDLPGLAGRNTLVGPNDERFGPRFPSMTPAYDPALRRLALALAPPELRARPGVYCGVGGPSYETWAECRFLRRVGGDAVGMSTVAEAVAARHCGLRVLGLSLITNVAPGEEDEEEEEEAEKEEEEKRGGEGRRGGGGGAGPSPRSRGSAGGRPSRDATSPDPAGGLGAASGAGGGATRLGHAKGKGGAC